MFNGKMKAVTFSYDDGILQDKRLIKMLEKYNLKCTFNLNSALFGHAGSLFGDNVTVAHVRPRTSEIRAIYEGHEIAVHTLHHPCLKKLTEEEVIREVEDDRLALSEIAGYEVVGMAYPGGSGCYTKETADIIRNNTGVKYSRTTTSTFNFDLQDNLIEFNPSVYHLEWDKMFELAEEFTALKPETPKLFYIWGHAYEFDWHDEWDRFEELCKIISRKNDIFYGTNKEVLLG